MWSTFEREGSKTGSLILSGQRVVELAKQREQVVNLGGVVSIRDIALHRDPVRIGKDLIDP